MTAAGDARVEMFGAGTGPDDYHGRQMRQVPLSVHRAGQTVPALVWLPAGAEHATRPRPLVLVGHGAGGHKAAPIVEFTAARVTRLGLAVLSIDVPYHGDRTPPEEVGLTAAERRRRLGLDGWRERNQRAVPQAVADWQAALDAAQALDEVGIGPVGYLGLSLGCRFGLPLAAAEDRITAAVLGLFGTQTQTGEVADSARRVSAPVLFLLQWDDELFPRDGGLALFDLLGSQHKTLHANPGRHLEIPPQEMADAAAFLDRHLHA